MSRLNVSSEPSMEEILASIRKIIAEDPSDARSAPAPVRQAMSVSPILDRAMFLRDAGMAGTDLMTGGSGPHDAGPAEPSTGMEATAEQPAPMIADAFAASHVEHSDQSTTTEPGALNGAMNDGGVATSTLAALVSVDEQLSDLLNDDHPSDDAAGDAQFDDGPAPDVRDDRPRSASALVIAAQDQPAGETTDADFSEIGSPHTSLAAALPGFAVSRDSYLPEDKSAAVGLASSTGERNSKGDDADDKPYGFSPSASSFGARVKAASVEQGAWSTDAALTTASASATAVVSNTPEFAKPAPAPAPFRMTNRSFADVNLSRGVDAPRRRDILETPKSAASTDSGSQSQSPYPSRAEPVSPPGRAAAPSIAATLPPVLSPEPAFKPRYASDTAETIARVTHALADSSRGDAAMGFVAVKVLENPVMSALMDRPQQVHPVAIRDLAASSPPSADRALAGASGSSLAVTTESQMPLMRSMEDTVADLLRPMLKSWLAENMPKIVERALRREISDLEGPPHSRAAE